MKKNKEEWHGFPENKYNKHAWIDGNPKIGEGTWIGAFTVINGTGGLEIGKNCDISCGAQIYTHSTVKRCVQGKRINKDGTINKELIEHKPVKIGDCTFIGPNSVILMGITIGKHCIVGAGSVVTKDIPDCSIVVGVPARVVGKVILKKDGVELKKL